MMPVTLSRKLLLETVDRVPDGSGGFSEIWRTKGELWADMKAGSGREKFGAGVTTSAVNYRITVRAAPFGAPSRPRPEERFRDGSQVFRILAVADADPSRSYLTCFAVEEVAG